jgi:hypothetical protein
MELIDTETIHAIRVSNIFWIKDDPQTRCIRKASLYSFIIVSKNGGIFPPLSRVGCAHACAVLVSVQLSAAGYIDKTTTRSLEIQLAVI